jgi:Tfp pilus assembly major pilin PilA
VTITCNNKRALNYCLAKIDIVIFKNEYARLNFLNIGIFQKGNRAMKKSPQAMLGVTLLEIMLVLAIAAMVIVMSIRYYQSAANNQKIAAGLNTITAVVSAGESYLASGPSTGLTALSNGVLSPYLGGSMPASPWGGAVTVSGVSSTSYTVSMPVSKDAVVCTQLIAMISQNSKLNSPAPTCAAGTLTVTVNE